MLWQIQRLLTGASSPRVLGLLALTGSLLSMGAKLVEARPAAYRLVADLTSLADRDLLISPVELYRKTGPASDVVQSSIKLTGTVTYFPMEGASRSGVDVVHLLSTRAEVMTDGARAEGVEAVLLGSDGVWFAIKRAPSGRVLGIWSPETQSEVVRSLCSTLMSNYQYTGPRFAAQRWTVEETLTDGRWSVEYVASEGTAIRARSAGLWLPLDALFKHQHGESAATNSGEITKTFTHYHNPDIWDVSASALTEGYERSGALKFKIRRGVMESVEGRLVRHHFFGNREGDRLELTGHFERLANAAPSGHERTPGFQAVFARTQREKPTPVWTYGIGEEARRRIARSVLGSATFEDAFDRAKEAIRTGDSAALIGARQQLEAGYTLDGRNVLKAQSKLIEARHQERITHVLASTLSAASTPASQSALLTALGGRLDDPSGALILLDALGESPRPEEAVMDALMDLSAEAPTRDLSEAAQLALGTLASTLRRTAPAWAAMIGKGLERQWTVASDEAQRRQLLLVMGNAGLVENLGTLMRYFSSQEHPQRQAEALDAMRAIQVPAVDRLLAKVLSGPYEDDVKLTASKAMALRPVVRESSVAQSTLLREMDDLALSRVLLHGVWRGRHDQVGLQATLKRTIARTSHAEIRDTAKAMLKDLESQASAPGRIFLK